jgi:hypothetical protein
MKMLTIRLPDALASQIEAESRRRKMSKSDVVRERLSHAGVPASGEPSLSIADIVGAVDGLPSDLSAQKKKRLKSTGYGNRRR